MTVGAWTRAALEMTGPGKGSRAFRVVPSDMQSLSDALPSSDARCDHPPTGGGQGYGGRLTTRWRHTLWRSANVTGPRVWAPSRGTEELAC